MKATSKGQSNKSVLTGRAWAPGHITGFFGIADENPDPLHRGSRGAGVSLAAGVTTQVTIKPSDSSGIRIHINESGHDAAPVSRRVIDLFHEKCGKDNAGGINVHHRIQVPQGAGFGSSGAGALSLALALNQADGSPLSYEQAAQTAHQAEVECRTGLGTVLACTRGGLEVRTRAGAPGVGEIQSFPLPAGLFVCCFTAGPFSTARALADPVLRRKINDASGSLAADLLAAPDASHFMQAARLFTDRIGLATPRVKSLLNFLDNQGLLFSMNMFGQAVFAILGNEKQPLVTDLARQAEAYGFSLLMTDIGDRGGHIIHEA